MIRRNSLRRHLTDDQIAILGLASTGRSGSRCAAAGRMPRCLPRTEHWADRICTQLGKSVEAIIEVGRLLVKAKKELAHGEWGRMFKDNLVPFSQNTAGQLMKIATHPQISNSAHAQNLPQSWTSLYELTKVAPKRLTAAFKDGIITPDMKRSAVTALLPVKPTRREAAQQMNVSPKRVEKAGGFGNPDGVLLSPHDWPT